MEYVWSTYGATRDQHALNTLATGFQQACGAAPVPQRRHAPCLIPAVILPVLALPNGLRLFRPPRRYLLPMNPLEIYLTELREIHDSGAATK